VEAQVSPNGVGLQLFADLSLYQFTQDGKEEYLSQTVHITIAPVANVDPSFSSATSRRPSLVGDAPRRLTSDIVPQTSPSRWVDSVVQVSVT
jgi:hypothetical protein